MSKRYKSKKKITKKMNKRKYINHYGGAPPDENLPNMTPEQFNDYLDNLSDCIKEKQKQPITSTPAPVTTPVKPVTPVTPVTPEITTPVTPEITTPETPVTIPETPVTIPETPVTTPDVTAKIKSYEEFIKKDEEIIREITDINNKVNTFTDNLVKILVKLDGTSCYHEVQANKPNTKKSYTQKLIKFNDDTIKDDCNKLYDEFNNLFTPMKEIIQKYKKYKDTVSTDDNSEFQKIKKNLESIKKQDLIGNLTGVNTAANDALNNIIFMDPDEGKKANGIIINTDNKNNLLAKLNTLVSSLKTQINAGLTIFDKTPLVSRIIDVLKSLGIEYSQKNNKTPKCPADVEPVTNSMHSTQSNSSTPDSSNPFDNSEYLVTDPSKPNPFDQFSSNSDTSQKDSDTSQTLITSSSSSNSSSSPNKINKLNLESKSNTNPTYEKETEPISSTGGSRKKCFKNKTNKKKYNAKYMSKRKSRRSSRSRRSRQRGGLFGASQYNTALYGKNIQQQEGNIVNGALLPNAHGMTVAKEYQGGARGGGHLGFIGANITPAALFAATMAFGRRKTKRRTSFKRR